MVRRRNFNVTVTSGDGERITFTGTSCVVKDKPLSARLGVGDVTETIECDSVKIKTNKK